MKTKFFFLVVLFMGISALMYAQTQAVAPSEKKKTKSGECTGHGSMGAKADCKWVDVNGDGKCDSCDKTEKECKEACKTAHAKTATKKGCAASCAHAKECGKSSGAAPSKDGKKDD